MNQDEFDKIIDDIYDEGIEKVFTECAMPGFTYEIAFLFVVSPDSLKPFRMAPSMRRQLIAECKKWFAGVAKDQGVELTYSATYERIYDDDEQND